MLDYEKLDAYRVSIEFLGLAHAIQVDVPRGHAQLTDQLRRAALSIPPNIAEGSGRTAKRERARHHSIARGSAMECGAILDCLLSLGLAEARRAAEGKLLVERLVAMLSRMSRG